MPKPLKINFFVRREPSIDIDTSHRFGKAERVDVVVYKDETCFFPIVRFMWNESVRPRKTNDAFIIRHDLCGLTWLPDLIASKNEPVPFPFPFKTEGKVREFV